MCIQQCSKINRSDCTLTDTVARSQPLPVICRIYEGYGEQDHSIIIPFTLLMYVWIQWSPPLSPCSLFHANCSLMTKWCTTTFIGITHVFQCKTMNLYNGITGIGQFYNEVEPIPFIVQITLTRNTNWGVLCLRTWTEKTLIANENVDLVEGIDYFVCCICI